MPFFVLTYFKTAVVGLPDQQPKGYENSMS